MSNVIWYTRIPSVWITPLKHPDGKRCKDTVMPSLPKWPRLNDTDNAYLQTEKYTVFYNDKWKPCKIWAEVLFIVFLSAFLITMRSNSEMFPNHTQIFAWPLNFWMEPDSNDEWVKSYQWRMTVCVCVCDSFQQISSFFQNHGVIAK